MESPHYRKIDLQSPADYAYLHTNTTNLSRQKLDLHFPPSANPNNGTDPDPMRERVKELVDDFITRTFTTASPSITINGLESPSLLDPNSHLKGPENETVEYEAYDTRLASRVTSLYAQLESLTTTVAQLRRDAPGKAAKGYVDCLRGVVDEEDLDGDQGRDGEGEGEGREERGKGWELDIPLGSENEARRWRSGDMREVYDDTLRTLLRLQGEREREREGQGEGGDRIDEDQAWDEDGNALASTVGKAERAGRAVEVVEQM